MCSVLYVVGNMFVDFCYWCGGNCIGGKFGDWYFGWFVVFYFVNVFCMFWYCYDGDMFNYGFF